jgi:penicillin-binding protein 2
MKEKVMSNFNGNDLIAGNSKYRLFIAGGVALLILLIFVLRLFKLQVVEGLNYQTKAQNVSRQAIEIPAQRGRIMDRNGELLAGNVDLFAVNVTPAEIPRDQISDVLERLGSLLNMSRSAIDRRIPPRNYRSPVMTELKGGVSLTTISYIAENIEKFPGVSWQSKPKRIYIHEKTNGEGGTVNHLLGYVGDISSEEIQMLYNQGYRRGNIIGKSGIEKQYDSELRGQSGVRHTVVDATGRRIQDTDRTVINPVHGRDLRLTIDMKIQRLAESALGNRRGSVIVMRPATGEILAMVSNPVFNANLFDRGGATSFAMQSIDPSFPFINRAISAEYPPASTFKTIVETAILEENAVDPQFKVLCNGFIRVGDRIFRCHKRDGHGWQNLSDALANSCNVYFWTITKDYLGLDANRRPDPTKLERYARLFGLGSLTEIDLPNEKEGLVPGKEWKESTWHSLWTGGDTLNMAIGQGFLLVTPLQMANAMAFVANNGVAYKPYVLDAVIDPVSGDVTQTAPAVLHSAEISPETWARLHADLRGTTLRGTGWMITRRVTIAGKTGTGEVGIDGSYHDWYIGYAPYEEPADPKERIVVAVQIESSNQYSWWSSKAADFVFQGVFARQNYFDVLRTLQPFYAIDGKSWRAITGDAWPAARAAVSGES